MYGVVAGRGGADEVGIVAEAVIAAKAGSVRLGAMCTGLEAHRGACSTVSNHPCKIDEGHTHFLIPSSSVA